MTPEQAFDTLVRGDASRPFITYYDEATGERTELSVKSLANWVAKTHHLLTDELGLGVGDTALVSLPAHWLTYPVLLGCLTAGLALTPDDVAADVAFVAPDSLARAEGVPETYAIAPESAAVGFRGNPPTGAEDFVAAVRPQADAWPTVQLTATDDDPYTAQLSRGDAMRAGADFAAKIGLRSGGRLLARAATAISEPYWTHLLLAPLAVGGSVVLVRNSPTAEVLDRRAAQERVDVVW